MKTNQSPRRDFLKKMGWSTLGLSTLPLAASSISSCQTKATEKAQTENNSGLAVRKNIADFAPDDPEIKLFKDTNQITQAINPCLSLS